MNEVFDCANLGLTHVPSNIPSTATHLWLSMNVITAIDVSDFNTLENLRFLYLDNNEIETIATDALSSSTRLTTLLLDGNFISTIPQGTFTHCKQLTMLDLRENRLTTIASTTFFGLESIEHLNLFGNAIETVECGAFNSVETASYLNADGNPTSCIVDTTNGRLQCDCGMNGGPSGYCSTSPDCGWKSPRFTNLVVHVQVAPPTYAPTADVTGSFTEGFDEDGFVGKLPVDKVSETSDFSVQGDANTGDKKPTMSTQIVAGLVVCVATVAALFGTVVVRQYRKRSEIKNLLARTDSSFSSSTLSRQTTNTSEVYVDPTDTEAFPPIHNNSVAGHQKSRLTTAQTSVISSSTDRSSTLQLSNSNNSNDDDCVSDWIKTPSIGEQHDEDRKSRGGSTIGSFKSSIGHKFMNYATSVWKGRMFTSSSKSQSDNGDSFEDSRLEELESYPHGDSIVINSVATN
jgi:hypothetical protein